MASSSISSRAPDEPIYTVLQRSGLKKLNRTRWTQNALTIIALVSLALMVVFLGMGQAGKIHPLTPLYAFSGSVVVFAIKKIFENYYQKPLALKHNIDFRKWLNDKRPEDKKKSKKKD